MLLFLTTDMAAVTSHANQQYGKSKVLINFVKLRDLSGYSEKSNIQEASCQKLAFRGKLSLRY